MTTGRHRSFPLELMSTEELLRHVQTTGASDVSVISALCAKLEGYVQREVDGALERPAWKAREVKLEDDLEIARRERDQMCRWAFNAAIDRLQEGLEVLALPTGPKNAREFDHNWAWLDCAKLEMRSLQERLVESFGSAEGEAGRTIKDNLPHQNELFGADTAARAADQKHRRRGDTRVGKQMKPALEILQKTPMSGAKLAELMKTLADPATARNMPRKLLEGGYVKQDFEGKLHVVKLG